MATRNGVLYVFAAMLGGIGLILLGYAGKEIVTSASIVLECFDGENRDTTRVVVEDNWFRKPTLLWKTDEYQINEFSEVSIRAEGEGISHYFNNEPEMEYKTFEIDRITGRMVVHSMFNPLITPILASRCVGGTSLEECKDRVGSIDRGSIYLCDIYAEEPFKAIRWESYCSYWMFGESVGFTRRLQCSRVQGKF